MKGVALVTGIIIIVLAVSIAAIPQFTTCGSQGKMLTTSTGTVIPMKCTWTGQAELALSLPLFAVGVLLLISRRKESLRNLSFMGMILGALVILLPTNLIGVCAAPGMICISVMMPAMIFFGTLTILTSIVVLIISVWTKEPS
ncbi:MAG: DUF4418 family protein [Chloroflexi bacterium]|nr:DUF4418 family protein [Chloroflexota bacterium]